MSCLPEQYKIINVAQTAAANAVTYDVVNCKDALKVWFVITHIGAADTDLTLSLIEAQDVAATTNTTAVIATFPIWADSCGTASDTLVRQTDAASYIVNTTAAGDRDQLVVIEWDPAKFSSGYDCIQLADAGGNASNNVTATAIIEYRYGQASLPTAIVD